MVTEFGGYIQRYGNKRYNASCNFIKSARYDDVLTIETFLKKKPMVKIEFDYKITNQDDELICTGNSVLAFMNMKTEKPTRCPDYLLEGLGF